MPRGRDQDQDQGQESERTMMSVGSSIKRGAGLWTASFAMDASGVAVPTQFWTARWYQNHMSMRVAWLGAQCEERQGHGARGIGSGVPY